VRGSVTALVASISASSICGTPAAPKLVPPAPSRFAYATAFCARSRSNCSTQLGAGHRGVQEGAVVATDDTVYSGFGFEGIRGAEKRKESMRGVLTHFGIL
jgi:hypothetical protein